MARSPLEEKLKENGCEVPIGEFQDSLEETFQGNYSNFSIDSLLLNPSEATSFCEAVRNLRKDYETLPDELILRSLLARRKNPL
jgi:hypothetical protein